MCLVETPLGIKVNLGNAFLARTTAAQDQARIFAIDQYPGIVFRVVTTILQPVRSSIYCLLDYCVPTPFIDAREQCFAMYGIRYCKLALVQDTHCVSVVSAF